VTSAPGCLGLLVSGRSHPSGQMPRKPPLCGQCLETSFSCGNDAIKLILKINVRLLAAAGGFWTGQHTCRNFSLLGDLTEYVDFQEAWASGKGRAGTAWVRSQGGAPARGALASQEGYTRLLGPRVSLSGEGGREWSSSTNIKRAPCRAGGRRRLKLP